MNQDIEQRGFVDDAEDPNNGMIWEEDVVEQPGIVAVSVTHFVYDDDTLGRRGSGRGQGGYVQETLLLTLINPDCNGLDELYQYQDLTVMSVSSVFDVGRSKRGVVRSRKSTISTIKVNVQGTVCLCDVTTVRDANFIQAPLVQGGAMALLCTVAPNRPSDDLPVFVASTDDFARLSSLVGVTITFGQQVEDNDGDGTDTGMEMKGPSGQAKGAVENANDCEDTLAFELASQGMEHSNDLNTASAKHSSSQDVTPSPVARSRQNAPPPPPQPPSGEPPKPSIHFEAVYGWEQASTPLQGTFKLIMFDWSTVAMPFVAKTFSLAVAGQICVCTTSDDADLMDRAHDWAAMNGAAALIVRTKPRHDECRLPVFVVGEEEMNNLVASGTTVVFDGGAGWDEESLWPQNQQPQQEQQHSPSHFDFCSDEESLLPKPQEQQQHDSLSHWSGQGYPEEENRVNDAAVATVAHYAPIPGAGLYGHYTPSPSGGFYEQYTHSPSVGLYGHYDASADNYGTFDLFAPAWGNVAVTDLAIFEQSLENIQKVLCQSPRHVIASIVTTAVDFFRDDQWVLGHLAAACHICLSVHDAVTGRLATVLIECLQRYDTRNGLDLLQPQEHVLKQPRELVFAFLMRFVVERANALSFLRSHQRWNNTNRDDYTTVVFLTASGFLEGQLRPREWNDIRAAINYGGLAHQRESISRLFGSRRETTVFLFFQPNLDVFLDQVRVLPSDLNRGVLLESYVGSIYYQLIVQRLNRDRNPKCLFDMWNTLLGFLGRVSFVDNALQELYYPRERIVKSVVALASFKRQASLQTLSSMYVATPSDHRDARSAMEAITSVLAGSLKDVGVGPTIDCAFLHLPVAKLLVTPVGLCVELDKFIKDGMINWSSLESKLLVLDILYKKCVGNSWVSNAVDFLRELNQHACVAFNEEKDALAALSTFFKIAAKRHDLFVLQALPVAAKEPSVLPASQLEACHVIASAALCESRTKEIMKSPNRIAGIPKGVPQSAKCFYALLRVLQKSLLRQCRPIEISSQFYCSVVSCRLSATSQLISIAEVVYFSALKQWKPVSIVGVPDEKVVLDALYLDRDATSKGLGLLAQTRRGDVESVFSGWLDEYQSDEMTLASLDHVSGSQRKQAWQKLEARLGLKLPPRHDMECKMREFTVLRGDINQSNVISVGNRRVQMEEVLQTYKIADTADRLLLLLFQHWSEGDKPRTLASQSLADLREVRRLVSNVMAVYGQHLFRCAYFLVFPSFLFYHGALPSNETAHSLQSLAESGDKAALWIKALFGSTSRYADVVQARQILSQSQSTSALDDELASLVGFPSLELSPSQISYFRVGVMLYDISTSLQDFVRCCEQFQLPVASADATFDSFCRDVKEFYSCDPESKELEACAAFFARFCSVLCPSQKDVSDSLRAIDALCPVLAMFSILSRQANVWNYVRDMGWLGEDGLKRFYEEYGNVTNVLLGVSATYELSLLDSMVPVVRLIAALSRLAEVTTLSELFDSCQHNSDIAIGMVEGTFGNLVRQINSKLSEIKDWFGNKVDEVAAAHSVFKAALHDGQYSIGVVDEEYSGGRKPLGLVLQFRTSKEDSEIRHLKGLALDEFIQHLSLIQNENSVAASDMQGFVDQFHELSRACANMITMHELGYGEMPLDSCRCSAGADHKASARQLLISSETHLSTFRSWLAETRTAYYASLLFWTAELLEVYELLTETGPKGDLPPNVLNYISRLQPLWIEKDIDRRTVHVQSCITGFLETKAPESGGWLVAVSRMLQSIHESLAAGTSGGSDLRAASTGSALTLHTISCPDQDENRMVLHVLQRIYKDRLPHAFEVLDGAIPFGEDCVGIFLSRAKLFPSCHFTIVNADKLCSKSLEDVVSFLSDNSIALGNFTLHIIQRGDTLVHTSPWVRGVSWENTALATSRPSWAPRMLNGVALTVVESPSCGSGKTRFIREGLTAFETMGDQRQAATLVVHEASSICSLVNALVKKLGRSCSMGALHVSFTCVPTRSKGNEAWFLELNHFFFSLLALRMVYDPSTTTSFLLLPTEWQVFVEIPESSHGESTKNWLANNFPILFEFSTFKQPRPDFFISNKARRVCMYLRALSTGTIDRKFEAGRQKRLILVLDCSSSMRGDPFQDALDNAVALFDSHVAIDDEFGVTLFDASVHETIPVQRVSDLDGLRRQLVGVSHRGRGTEMYSALRSVLLSVSECDSTIETWIVCLTDGESGWRERDNFRLALDSSPENVHLVMVGVNLSSRYEQELVQICAKYASPVDSRNEGFFVRADGSSAGLSSAFGEVKGRIPVSQTFERDGELSDEDCIRLLAKYLPPIIEPLDMQSRAFWVSFLFRRTQVLDQNKSFNYNETHDALGSSLVKVMLAEVERLLGSNMRRDWLLTNHAQMIYDFTVPGAPEFRLVCTAPESLDADLRRKLSDLNLPGFCIPTKQELECRDLLDRYLSQALDVPLQTRKDGTQVLQCIDDVGFILTLDFTMKLLSIHERIACRIPCLLEGETGVSKTALTKMYSILRNSAAAYRAREETIRDLEDVETELKDDGFEVVSVDDKNVRERLHRLVVENADAAGDVFHLLIDKIRRRPPLFAAYCGMTSADEGDVATEALKVLEFFDSCLLEKTFFEINVDASLTETDFVRMFLEIRSTAARLMQVEATVVVFLDEINTSSVLGLLKEAVTDHSLMGDPLPRNVVIVAACNPPRSQIAVCTRERDLGKSWASGHYQVSSLPPSLSKIKWSFGSLTHSQEKDFILRRIEAFRKNSIPKQAQEALSEVLAESHETMRRFAERNILADMRRTGHGQEVENDAERSAKDRARSIVSLRDIQRVFSLFDFFLDDAQSDLAKDTWTGEDRFRTSMLMSIATVYYLRLDGASRLEFLEMLNRLPSQANQSVGLLQVLDHAMNAVIVSTDMPPGIAITRGLKENVFVTFVCAMSQTPLIIVGPPGSSKTLAVHIVGDNASGSDSLSPFYKARPRLSLFHYQCSKQSTSKEISEVFDQATQRQDRVDARKHRCVVFMDEAGLPEDEKESLKVLHYLLESHMSAKAKVGFVAISNHVLDAAKSNRCVMLLRQDPDEEEMSAIASGVLFDSTGRQACAHRSKSMMPSFRRMNLQGIYAPRTHICFQPTRRSPHSTRFSGCETSSFS